VCVSLYFQIAYIGVLRLSSSAVQVRRRTEGHGGAGQSGRHPDVHRVQGRRPADVEEERNGDQAGREEVRAGGRRDCSSAGDPRRAA